jgi:5-methyltetrahydrofolate--homocysteine methyltransferase
MTAQPYSNRRFLDALKLKVLVFDGAMGTSLQTQKLTASHFGGERYEGCNDYLVLSYPEAVMAVHRSFLEVGVDVIETDSFRANRLTLQEYGLQDQTLEINRAAARLARQAADEFDNPAFPRFVAGSMGPTGMLPSANDPDLSDITYDELADLFREQAVGLIQGGVDLLLLETSQDILEVKAAIHGIQLAFAETDVRLPVQAQVTLDTTGRMLLGTDITAALAILEGLPIDVIGLNCSTGPEHMRNPIRYLGENASLPVSCIPNAGLPLNVDGEAVYPLEPEPYAAQMAEFVEKFNVSVVGGCCGTTPEHLKRLVDRLQSAVQSNRSAALGGRLASATTATFVAQEPPPLLVGERCNATGSRKFKEMLLKEDYDSILELARSQVARGAHALDISVALTERPDEAYLMAQVVKKLSMGVEVPLVIDSTEAEVLEAALKLAPGRCLLNSTNLEAGRPKLERVLALGRQHNAAVLFLTIDEEGMAKTADRKVAVAKRIHDIAVDEYGFRPEDLVFDVLTFPLSTGDPEFASSAVETIAGIRKLKAALPGVFTSLGISNVSFGLGPAARSLLNSLMLYHCVQAGLDMAIVNAAHITPVGEIPAAERALLEDLIFNRQPDALARVIEHFERVDLVLPGQTQDDPTADMTPEERLHWCILHRHKEGVEADIDKIIERETSSQGEDSQHEPPSEHDVAVHVLNNVLLPGMKEVGDRFGAGELILPFVLQSAEVMKKAVTHVEQYLERLEGTSKGTVILATVFGDVHDIGKNLVKTILDNNGYRVVDLGKQVPAQKIIDAAVAERATAIGLSALLVSTSKQMPLIVNELQRQGLDFPVLIGGAAINRRFGRRILYTEAGPAYEPGVFYCKDAFEGLATMDALTDPPAREALLSRVHREAELEIDRAARPKAAARPRSRPQITPAPVIPKPAGWGAHIVHEAPLEMVFQQLFINELFRLSWGGKNTQGEAWQKMKADFEHRLTRMKREALAEGWLAPRAVYGYWPAQAAGDDLVLYQPESVEREKPAELVRFSFPRQPGGDRLCLADYFSPAESGVMDVVALQVVTVGELADARFEALQAEGNYAEAYFTHGLAVQTAEATAEYIHRHIRRELGLAAGQGKRYSWGYPAIPELADHRIVFDLLPAESALGMKLTSAFQLVPEQSTAAIVVHHPAAKYYSVGESRVEQLMK